MGCGFGLFSLFYAMRYPRASLRGIDRDSRRIAIATPVARKLGLSNVTYQVAEVTSCNVEGCYDGAYMLDVIHHIPAAAVMPVFKGRLSSILKPGSRLAD